MLLKYNNLFLLALLFLLIFVLSKYKMGGKKFSFCVPQKNFALT